MIVIMYIVYCDNMQNITSCNPREGIIRYRVALFLFALFRNISQYISKYFEIFFERFCIFILLMYFISTALINIIFQYSYKYYIRKHLYYCKYFSFSIVKN